MKTVVSEKGQVTIPKPLRDRLGIKPGQVLEVTEEGGRLVASKVSQMDPLESVYGILPSEPDTDEQITSMRGEPDAT